ncbi:MAG: TolC family protein [Desulfomonilaceae bacterium]
MAGVAGFAVVNNPDLRAVRLKAGVARAQLFDARLLPDPQISASADYPISQVPDNLTAYSLGLDFNFGYFVTRRAAIDAAAAKVGQIDLDIIWQEWQVAQQARILFIRSIYLERKLALLKHMRNLYARRYVVSSEALRKGNLTLDVTGTDLTAKIDSATLVNDMEQQLSQAGHELNAILGVWPDAKPRLFAPGPPQGLEEQEMNQLLIGMPQRRPDLMALRAGYESQEAKVHKAVLGQFPALTVGVNQSSDNTNVHYVGNTATLTLPFFNRNRGKIAVQAATREQIHQEYQARLDKAYQDVALLWAKQGLSMVQLRQLQAYIPTLATMVRKARRAYANHNMDPVVYLNMENTLANKRLKAIGTIQLLWETEIALDTLLARPVTPDTRDGR